MMWVLERGVSLRVLSECHLRDGEVRDRQVRMRIRGLEDTHMKRCSLWKGKEVLGKSN